MTTKQIIKFTLCLLLILFAAELSTAQKPELVVQTGHPDAVQAIAFSPDGKILASGSWDNSVKLWEVASGKELRTLGPHYGRVYAVVFSPDNKILASGSGGFMLWDVETGKRIRLFDEGTPLAFSPDGKTLAIEKGEAVELLSIPEGKVLQTLNGHSENVNSAAFSSDGRLLATGADTIKLWALATGKEIKTLNGHSKIVTSVTFSPDGKSLASGSYDATAKIWNLATGTLRLTLKGHSSSVSSVAFSPDGRFLASGTGGGDSKTRLWEVLSGKLIRTLSDHPDFLRVTSVAFSPDGRTLASGIGGNVIGRSLNMVELWDVTNGTELNVLRGHSEAVRKAVFSPGAKVLVSESEVSMNGKYKQGLRIWPLATNAEPRMVIAENPVTSSPLEGEIHFAFGSDDKTMAISHGETIELWNLITNTISQTLRTSAAVIAIAFDPNSKTLASATVTRTSGNWIGSLILWDVKTGAKLRELPGGYGNSLAFSPDGRILLSVSGSIIDLWDLSAGAPRSLKGYSGDANIIGITPDGKTLVSTGSIRGTNDYDEPEITLWDMSTGNKLHSLKGASFAIAIPNSTALSPDGRRVASATGGGAVDIKLWDVATGGELRTLKGDNTINTLTFSPDGKYLVSAGTDGTIYVWDVVTGKHFATLRGHLNRINSVAFSSDGRFLVTGSNDTTVRVWDFYGRTELASLLPTGENDWLITTPTGLFDGSPLAWRQILWRFSASLFDVRPAEVFFNDYYYPGLLADIFAGKNPQAPSDISQKDRRQPQLKLRPTENQSGTTLATRNLTVTIDVAEANGDQEHKAGSGAQDVRLFRNGSLVKVWRGDVLKGQTSVTLEATIPIVAGENRLTAYAFNHDNIKSEDASLTVTGADSLKRKGTLHILAVGVSQYANEEYNLNYTTEDATSFATQLKLQQEKLVQENLVQKKTAGYESVEIKTLLNENATKANILAELKKLAGTVQPEDAVVVYFSGHGKASGDHFYLVPHDLGYNGSRDQLSSEGLKLILAHSISDLELEEAFRGIDAGQMFMIIDACNSGQALENKDEPRRGPMNTRGLAQLAYEKGMYIMTASQNVEEAFVSERLKHSYLTFALVEEGLKTKAADADHNGEVTLREWFDYALARVPKLREEVLQTKSLEEVTPKMKAARNQKSQTPRVFYRREAEQQPLIIARP
jgi:WD40 repeat protein/uncharacterized caspase-like protein